MSATLGVLGERLRRADTLVRSGRVVRACGTLLEVSGLNLAVGDLCRLHREGWQLDAEVVGLAPRTALLMPLGDLQGLASDARVVALGTGHSVGAGEALLGRVIDADGVPCDGGGPLALNERAPLHADPPPPMVRRPISAVMSTGVRAIDTLLTVGEGQRIGIFAAAGAGKTTLLGMLARGTSADVTIVALIGERGREVHPFVREQLKPAKGNWIAVVATSDQSAIQRARALSTATALAEYFRARGQRVLLLADSVTRYARALRDIGLAAGEPPTRRGFPPSVFSQLPRLLERAGNDAHGSITAFYTVLVEDEQSVDPVAEEVRSILDGHICLTRELAARQHYPAIDVLASVSRVMNDIVSDEHAQAARAARTALARYRDVEVLLQMGEYQHGADPSTDSALACVPRVNRLLTQPEKIVTDFEQSLLDLRQASQANAGVDPAPASDT